MQKRLPPLVFFLGLLASLASLAQADFTAPAVNISKSALQSKYPKIAAIEGTALVFAVWVETNGTNDYLYFSKSTDSAATWSTPFQLSVNGQILTQDDLYDDYAFSLCVSDPYVHIVIQWRANPSEDYDIYYIRSTDLGDTWDFFSWNALTVNDADSMYPDVAAYGQYVHVAYQDYWPGNFDIMYKRIPNYGDAGPDLTRRLTFSASDSWWPRIAVSNGGYFVSVVYQDVYSDRFNIFFKSIGDYGAGSYATYQLTYTTTGWNGRPDIVTGIGSLSYEQYVHIVYETDYPGNFDIMYKRLSNYGSNPVEILTNRLSYSTTESRSASISYDTGYNYMHVSYHDNWPGNNDVMYRKMSGPSGGAYSGQRVSWGSGDSAHATNAASGAWAYVAWSDNTSGNYEIYVKYGY